MPDDEERPREPAGAAGADWADVRAPDDISELADDVAAYHRERRRLRRGARARRVLRIPGSVPLSTAVAVLALAGIVVSLLTMFGPATGPFAATQLPAPHTTLTAGQVGGPVPDVRLLDTSGRTVDSQSLRPAVLALLPVGCGCAPLLSSLSRQAATAGLPLDIVAPSADDAAAAALAGQVTTGHARVLFDPTGALARTFATATVPTGGTPTTAGLDVVVMDHDGTAFGVRHGVTAGDTSVTPLLRGMAAAGSAT